MKFPKNIGIKDIYLKALEIYNKNKNNIKIWIWKWMSNNNYFFI
jgi:hypothetical protein